MEIGIDSFAMNLLDNGTDAPLDGATAIGQLLDRIERADQVGLDVFGHG